MGRQLKKVISRTSVLCVTAALMTMSFTTAQAAALRPLQSKDGMVVSTQKAASDIGTNVLKNGGNAIDAAVAVGFAMAVCHPCAGNIGGGGFAVIHMADGRNMALDFREKAPLAATRDMYLDKQGNVIPGLSTLGYKAAGVPGTVKGMTAMRDKLGTKPLAELMAPAIKMADEGFTVSIRQEETMADAAADFKKFPASSKYFLHKDGSIYKAGEKLVQKDLAKTLKGISATDGDSFYTGVTAEQIAKDMKANNGLITKEDLAKYNVVWREPSEGTYRGYEILSMCPPSSGGTHIVEILNIMEKANMGKLGFGTAASYHVMAEAMRQAYADRSEYMGDPDFVKVPVKELTDKNYANMIYNSIDPNKATSSDVVRPGLKAMHEGNNTTHYSIVDKWGNAVSITYTINDYYGAKASVAGAGFLLNNEMDDFSIKPGVPNMYGLVGGDANAVEPEKRPLSSMSPSIVLKDGKLFMVVGSPGGARIITTTLQVISNVIDYGMNISEAVMAPRIHMQWLPDEIRYEKYGLNLDVAAELHAMGYKLALKDPMGDVNAIMLDQKTGMIYGSCDPRNEF